MSLIWKLMKIVCRGAGFLFHLMKQLFSAVNYRGNPRQLTAAGFQIPRQLTAEGVKGYFTCVSQPYGMCQQQFSDKGYNRIIIESDSKEAVDYLRRGTITSCAFSTLLSDIFRLMSVMEAIKIVHVYREANKVADALAKWGLNQDTPIHYFDVVPNFCNGVLLADRASTFSL